MLLQPYPYFHRLLINNAIVVVKVSLQGLRLFRYASSSYFSRHHFGNCHHYNFRHRDRHHNYERIQTFVTKNNVHCANETN